MVAIQRIESLVWLRKQLEARRVNEGKSAITVRLPRSRVGLLTCDQEARRF